MAERVETRATAGPPGGGRPGPFGSDELASVFRPLGESTGLPARAYRWPEVFDWEVEHVFDRSWVCVGRSADLPEPGDQVAVTAGSETVLLVRGRDGVLRGFFNTCRHRGHVLLETGDRTCRTTVMCPYHAWVYNLDGRLRGAPGFQGLDRDEFGLHRVRVEEWHGWAFANLSGDAPPLDAHLGDLDEYVRHHEPERLVVAAEHTYVVEANWKIAHENYHECYHCSNIHPELCVVTPPDSGRDLRPTGVWSGGTMDLRSGAATMSLTGESRASTLRGLSPERARQVSYLGLLPNLLISLHPDYVLTHRMTPLEAGRTEIECQWLFSPEDAAEPGFDPSFAVEFWDITNRQDWHAIEGVHKGMASRGFVPGPLSDREGCVRLFDVLMARAYLTGRSVIPEPEDLAQLVH